MSTESSLAHATQAAPLSWLLRQWRTVRGLSQMELALRSGFSARHVSFIETGRTQPSRHALLTLAETLDIPLRERNRLLEAAGYAAVYRHTAIEAQEMTHIRGVLQFILERHTPYAAVVHDRYTNCVMGNAGATNLVAALVDPLLLVKPVNYLRITFHPQGARRWILNWDEVARHLLARADRELGGTTNDPAAVALLREIHGYAGTVALPYAPRCPVEDMLLPIHIRKDDVELRVFSTIMTLGTPQDVTLQELRIETFFPADEASERTWPRVARSGQE